MQSRTCQLDGLAAIGSGDTVDDPHLRFASSWRFRLRPQIALYDRCTIDAGARPTNVTTALMCRQPSRHDRLRAWIAASTKTAVSTEATGSPIDRDASYDRCWVQNGLVVTNTMTIAESGP
jgi:hypothetical protein